MNNTGRSETKSQHKGKKLPIKVYLLYILIATFICTGITFSKYVTSGLASDSARVARISDIMITETGASGNVNNYIIIPGVNIEKDAKLRFGGAEFACYVFLQVKPTGWTTADNEKFSYKVNGADRLSWEMANGWTYLTTENGMLIYYRILQANDAIDSGIIKNSSVTVSDSLIRSEIDVLPTLSIEFKATAVQLDGFGDFATEAQHAQAAWNSVSAQ